MNHIEQAMREASELIYKGYRKAAQKQEEQLIDELVSNARAVSGVS